MITIQTNSLHITISDGVDTLRLPNYPRRPLRDNLHREAARAQIALRKAQDRLRLITLALNSDNGQ